MAQHVKFHQYFFQWMQLYKLDAVRPVTYRKYEMSHRQLVMLAPDLKMTDLSRLTYQQLLNDYAETHERQTTMDFHRHLKGSLIDALEEGFIDRDPTRKAIIKGIKHRQHKTKYLHQYELQALLNELNLNNEVNWDYFILLIAKTGIRFAEALGVTPADFDFAHQTLSISKTWDYKSAKSDFAPTKNNSSVRKVPLDWQTVIQFSQLTKKLPEISQSLFKQKCIMIRLIIIWSVYASTHLFL